MWRRGETVLGGPGTNEERADEHQAVEDRPTESEAKRAVGQRPTSLSSAAEAGERHIADLTGKETIGVVAVEPAEDGWFVTVETVEERRIPSSGDLLAVYEAEIDMAGNVLAYRRLRRYPRGRGDNGKGR
jgi:hypothetical protein